MVISKASRWPLNTKLKLLTHEFIPGF
jgi:hypothetical protein